MFRCITERLLQLTRVWGLHGSYRFSLKRLWMMHLGTVAIRWIWMGQFQSWQAEVVGSPSLKYICQSRVWSCSAPVWTVALFKLNHKSSIWLCPSRSQCDVNTTTSLKDASGVNLIIILFFHNRCWHFTIVPELNVKLFLFKTTSGTFRDSICSCT